MSDKKAAIEESPHKYIILRQLRGRINALFEQYDDLQERGYTYKVYGGNTFSTLAGNHRGILAKPEDVEFLKEQALAQAKLEAGIPKLDCGLKEHYVLLMPHDIDFPWKEELKNVQRNKVQVLKSLNEHNLGMSLPAEPPSCGVPIWLQNLRERHVGLYTKYIPELQSPTEVQRVIAEQLKVAHEEKKTENLVKGAAKAKETRKNKTKKKDVNVDTQENMDD
jgi:hypothetical protein